MKNLQELFTLVVPVRERHFNLPSIIGYYKNQPYRKIIYDASTKRYDGDLADFEYHHSGPEFQHQSYLKAYKMVRTPFLINCPDDDIMTHDSIEKCVNFLHENEQYAACDGEVVEWDPHTNKTNSERKPEVCKSRIVHDWDLDNVLQRVNFGVVESSRSCCHSFLRTKDAIEIMENFMQNKQICPISFLDRVYTFATLCKGPIKTLPIVQHIRTSNSRPNSDRNMNYKDIAKEDWDGYGLKAHIAMEDNLDDHHVSCFSHFLQKETKMSQQEALDWTIQLYKNHFRTRRENGGGGYFGEKIDTNHIQMPCKQEKFANIVREATKCMRIGDK